MRIGKTTIQYCNVIYYQEDFTFTVIYDAGMRPTSVAAKKIWKGMSTIGDAILMNVLGKVGVILRKSI
jgi:hypothetical protein